MESVEIIQEEVALQWFPGVSIPNAIIQHEYDGQTVGPENGGWEHTLPAHVIIIIRGEYTVVFEGNWIYYVRDMPAYIVREIVPPQHTLPLQNNQPPTASPQVDPRN